MTADSWISVKDRLPEDEEPVLSHDGESAQIAWYSADEECWCWRGRYDSGVTHWQPIVPPLTGGSR